MKIKDNWKRIEKWMKINAIETFNSLNGGAKKEEIEKCEVILGIKFPSDIRDSFIRHNGQKECEFGFFDASELLSLERIKECWSSWQELFKKGTFDNLEPDVDSEIKPVWFNSFWIPIAVNNTGDTCIDLDPSSEGNLGQIIFLPYKDPDRRVVAPSFNYLLNTFADDLENDQYVYSDDYGGVVPFWYD